MSVRRRKISRDLSPLKTVKRFDFYNLETDDIDWTSQKLQGGYEIEVAAVAYKPDKHGFLAPRVEQTWEVTSSPKCSSASTIPPPLFDRNVGILPWQVAAGNVDMSSSPEARCIIWSSVLATSY
ncbi:hypothetical protein LINPERPRIM_LOCUS18583 [Linum perenne]